MPVDPPTLTLASASPRRRELLAYLGVRYRAISTDAEDEDHPAPSEVCACLPEAPVPQRWHPALLAWRKADAACVLTPDSVIIGADTIVVLDGDVLNKPLDAGEARQMLRRLSGRTHRVYTGLAAIVRAPGTGTQGGGRLALDLVASDVTLDTLDDQAIEAYVSTGEPLDKAGAYGIQGLGGRLVRQVLGSYTNVVGLPLAAVHALLAGAGFAQLVDPCEAYQRWLHTQGKEPLPCPPTFP